MRCAITKLYATNTGEQGWILLSAWIPIKKEDGYHSPDETAIGFDIWVKNVIDLKESEGPVEVKVVKCDDETGMYLICPDRCYLGDEKHLYNTPVRYEPGTKHFDSDYHEKMYDESPCGDYFGMHIATDFDMKEGDGPYNVTLERI